MTLFKTIKQSQILVQQLSRNAQTKEDESLLASLAAELEKVATFAQQLSDKTSQPSGNSSPEIKSGCYIFAGQKGFFCPYCYDNDDKKIATKRMNSKLRVCPACRSSIK